MIIITRSFGFCCIMGHMSEYSKRERFKTVSCALVLLMDGDKVLLQKRDGTGWADGMWDFSASGHVEEGEPMSEAAIRETKEEIGITVKSLEFLGLVHSLGDDGTPRYLGVFKVTDYEGKPKICEPDKCSELKWFDIHDLPTNIIESRRLALDNLSDKKFYLEYGWK